jgi:apolipoprotein N-acyltransferase
MIYGNSQACYPSLIQFADITSVYGVSFWVAAVNVALYRILRRPRSFVNWTLIIALFVAPYLYSRSVIARGDELGETLSVALIQGNVPPDEKWEEGMEEWNINLYRSMSIQSMEYHPQLIVWPETAVPAYLADIAPYRRMVQSLVDSIGVPVLTGMPAIDWSTGKTWNAAGLFSPGGTNVARYDKLHLVPFGEAFPFDDIFPSLRNINMGQANWDEGTDIVVFDTPGLPPFNAVICFESIFPDLVRRFIVRGSQMIVVITNDVWFGHYASPIQHAMISVMRAIEFHRPVIRCANTGISMTIDRYGRIQDRTRYGERTYLIATARPSARMTFYAKHGNVFGIGCFVVSLAAAIGYFIARAWNLSAENAVQ